MLYDVLSGLSEQISYSPVYEVKIGPFCSFKVQFVSLQIKARDLNLDFGLHQSIHKLRHDVNKYVMTSKLS